MALKGRIGRALVLSTALVLSSCGEDSFLGPLVLGDDPNLPDDFVDERTRNDSSFFDLFQTQLDPNVTLEVNKYIWNASLEILNFLPVEQADPFSGVLVTGFGTPPGGSTAYRATIFVRDPALDARSLSLSMRTRSGPVDPDTLRAVEDAILTRARQLRVQEANL
ncbi:MAG: DUF3576 domain-containing protein [Pseudomonadota bacterium]